MIETDLSSLIIEDLQEGENRDKVLRLIWVQNLDTTDYRFRVLFKLAEPKGRYISAKIEPQLLFNYVPGAFYMNSQRLENPPAEGEIIKIFLDLQGRNSIKTVGKAFSDDLYDLRYGRVNYSKSQYCVTIETETQEIVFPCFILGATYYFTSASMCRQLFAQALEGLYKRDSIEIDYLTRHARIYLNTNAADGDAGDIIRFAKNEYANRQWKRIVHNLRREQQRQNIKHADEKNLPLIADFPICAKFQAEVRAVRLFYPELGKEKVLVLEIIEENSPFDFDKITIERISMPTRTVDVTRRSKARSTTRISTTRIPSAELASTNIKNTEPPKNINKANMNIVKEYEEKPARENTTVPPVVSGEGKADIGLSESARDGDPGTRHGEVKPAEPQEAEKRYKESFTLADFQKMVTLLKEETNVQNFRILGPLPMPQREGENVRGSLWEFFDKEQKRKRKYLRVTFTYKQISVCLIEIDQNRLPSTTATYVFLYLGQKEILQAEIQEFLNKFVNRTTIKAIDDHFRDKGFIFYSKNHPIDKEDDSYEAWRYILLRRIESLAENFPREAQG